MNEQSELQPELLDGASLDVADQKRREVLDLFPEARTESGNIDFDVLKRSLGETVDPGKERYGLTWPGRAACFKTVQTSSVATLLPVPERSVNFDTAENVIIEGDNLQVLKLLQKAYLGAVKLIYIDPPYNTGNDFIYPDDYSESLQTYLEYTGQVDDEGRKFGTNAETDGRFHSKWLTMMYPRLYLARNLLRDDGILCLSIGDTELANATMLLNDIFGESNRIGIVARVTKRSSNKGEHFAPSKDYLVVYARAASALPPLMDEQDEEYRSRFKGKDTRGDFAIVGLYQAALDARPNQRYWVECPDGSLAIPPGSTFPEKQVDAAFVPPAARDDKVWRWSYESYLAQKDRLVFKETLRSPLLTPNRERSKWNVYTKYYLQDRIADGTRPRDIIEDITNDKGATALKALGLDDVFPFAKPVELIQRCLTWIADPTALCLDFFAGSGTTAQAVSAQNALDDGRRRYILVQLPEPIEHPQFATIVEIAEERMRRVDASSPRGALAGPGDNLGFRVFTLAESNLNPWNADVAHEAPTVAEQMTLHVDHLRTDRTVRDVLYEVLIKSGYPLTSRVDAQSIAGKDVHSVADGAFIICLDRALNLDVVRGIADKKPERVLLLDEGFAGNDQLKANAVQTFRAKGIVLKTL